MTRTQLAAVAALSLASTGIVLADSGDNQSSAAMLRAVARVAAAGRAAATASPAVVSGPAAPVPLTAPPAVTPSPTPAPVAPAQAAVVSSTPAAHHTTPPAPPSRTPSKIGHVFLIALSGTGADQTFGPGSPAPYLAGTLRPEGALLDNYSPLGTADLPNYLALISGQAPNAASDAECPTYTDFPSSAKPDKNGTIAGDGCVYPNTVLTLADQITSAGGSWRGYAESMGDGPPGAQACRHPDSGGPDDTLRGRAGDEYATRHNPFAYFHSLLDLGDCITNDVTLDKLPSDLSSARTTPTLSFIAPDLCDDGTEAPCADGRPGGPAAADAFLQQWVPRIQASPAYKRDGLIVVAFLSAAPPAAGQPAPAAPPRTGALLLSRFAKPGATIDTPYGPYELLHSIEDLLALAPLAHANGTASFVKAAVPSAVAGRR